MLLVLWPPTLHGIVLCSQAACILQLSMLLGPSGVELQAQGRCFTFPFHDCAAASAIINQTLQRSVGKDSGGVITCTQTQVYSVGSAPTTRGNHSLREKIRPSLMEPIGSVRL